jgi:hypothetical protein
MGNTGGGPIAHLAPDGREHDLEEHLREIALCRTAALGGHLDRCTACGHERPSYNSCRNRHCPKCQSLAQHRWLEARRERLLPVHYFHVVFTLPSELRDLARDFSARGTPAWTVGPDLRAVGCRFCTGVIQGGGERFRAHDPGSVAVAARCRASN